MGESFAWDLSTLLGHLKRAQEIGMSMSDLVKIAPEFSEEITSKWKRIAQYYFDLRIECLK